MRPELAAAVHAAAELLPVSSSAHLRAVGDGTDDVAAHAVPLLVTVVVWRRAVPRLDGRRVLFHLVAGGIPSVVGVVVGDRRHRLPAWVGMAVGSVVLASTACTEDGWDAAPRHGARRRGGRARAEAGLVDGVVLGLAQAAALWPGVSRLGTTLAVARWRGFAPDEAPLLAREVGVPVTAGALLWQLRHTSVTGWSRLRTSRVQNLDHPPVAALAGGFVGAIAAVPLATRIDRGGSLIPYAVERAVLALVLLRQSRPHE